MKILKSFTVLAILNIVNVFAIFYNERDDTFEYLIQDDDTAQISDVINKNATILTIQPFVELNGKTYQITELRPSFLDSNVETINISKSFSDNFNIRDNAFYAAKKLKNLNVYTTKATASEQAFNNVNEEINITGEGASNLMKSYAMNLVKSIGILPRKYVENVEIEVLMKDYFSLGRYVKMYFEYTADVAHGSNGGVALALKKGDLLGIARAFRFIMIGFGFEDDDIYVVTDNKEYSWNIVKLGNQWYNFDIYNIDFSNFEIVKGYNESAFLTDSAYNNQILKEVYGDGVGVDPSEWSIYTSEVGYEYEVPVEVENFNDWLSRNGIGNRTP